MVSRLMLFPPRLHDDEIIAWRRFPKGNHIHHSPTKLDFGVLDASRHFGRRFWLQKVANGTIFQPMTCINHTRNEVGALEQRYGSAPAQEITRKDRELLPGGDLEASRMPGHWLLARLGKRVLRPGGLELTQRLVEGLDIRSSDCVVEFAPGLGVTARLTLARHPIAYTAIERDAAATRNLCRFLTEPQQKCLCGSAEDTGLASGTASVVYGEAMLTMQGPAQKALIVREAFRLLQPGGRYGLHELCFTPEELDERIKAEVQTCLSESIRVGARPLTAGEWRALLAAEGFEVKDEWLAPMHLLEPGRLLRDEGIWGTGRFVWNVLRDRDARTRVRAMCQTFRKYEAHLAALALVAYKPRAESPN